MSLPDFDVVDPHMHLFDVANKHRPATYRSVQLFGWSERVLRFMMKYLGPQDALAYFGERTDMLRDYLPASFRADSRSSRVKRYVHIQVVWEDHTPLAPVGETRWLEQLEDGPAAMVAFADLLLGQDVAEVLNAHIDASDRVRGIRHMIAWHEKNGIMNFAHEPEISRSSEFRSGFEQLAAHNLSFDAWCFGDQISEVRELAASCPEVPVVLCHTGTPVGFGGEFQGIGSSKSERESIASKWRDDISALAEQPQVMCKISGLLMPAMGFGYEKSDASPSVAELTDRLSPLVTHCIDAFTPERCMIASNFPVDRVSADYETVTRAMFGITSEYGEAAQRSLFADTAAKFYRL